MKKTLLIALLALGLMFGSVPAEAQNYCNLEFSMDSMSCLNSKVVVNNTTNTNITTLVYSWYLPGTNYWSGWQGFDPPSNIIFTNSGNWGVALNATDTATGMIYSVTRWINIISPPTLFSYPPSQNINLCAGDSILITYSGANNYEWWENGIVVNTADSLWISGTQNLLVIGYDTYGCQSQNFNSVYVDKEPQLSMYYQQGWTQTPIPSGNQVVDLCDQGSSSLGVVVNGGWGVVSWNNGYGSYSFPIDTAGAYVATLTTQNGCVYNSDTISVNLLPSPVVTIHALTEPPYCYNAIVNLECSSSPQGVSYYWINGNQIPQTTAQISVNSSTFGAYQAFALAPNGCWGASPTYNINFNPPVPVPYISVDPNGWQAIATSGYSTYQWYMDTSMLVGQNAQLLGITNPGFYIVEVTDQYGCSEVSDPVFIMPNTTGIDEMGADAFNAFPNPVSDVINIDLPNDGREYQAVLCDITGRIVKTFAGASIIKASREGIAPGTYLLSVTDGKDNKYNKKVLIQ